jgi:hypothetical protein
VACSCEYGDEKLKLSHYRHAGAKGERIYSSLFLTSALDGGERLASRPGRTHCTEAGWTSELVWTQRLEEKCFASAGDRTPEPRSSSLQSDATLTELPQLIIIIMS